MTTEYALEAIRHTVTGRKPAAVHLTLENAARLEQIASSDPRPSARLRAIAVLRIARGARTEVLAQELGISRATIRRYTRRFNREGLEALLKPCRNPQRAAEAS